MQTFYAILPHRGSLLVEGPDTRQFLQGQLTCDVTGLTAERSLPGAYCTPKGRVVFDFRMVEAPGDAVHLMTQAEVCGHALSVMAKYIAFSRAEARDTSDDWVQLGLWGDPAAAMPGLVPGENGAVTTLDGVQWIQVDDAGQRFEALCPAERVDAVSGALEAVAAGESEAAYRLQELRAGIGHVRAANTEEFLPQMLNLQALGHVSFTKGCYTGQEVVARMHYKGNLKKPMYLATCESDTAPVPGTPLFNPGGAQAIGTVVDAEPDGREIVLLAVVNRAAIDSGVHLGDASGPMLHITDLPYSLERE